MKTGIAIILLSIIAVTVSRAAPQPLPLAVLDFQTPDQDTAHFGKDAAALLNSKLSESQDLILVERQELQKILGEQELGLSGNVTPDTAAKVGQLTGAKVLVTGRLFNSGDKYFIVAKVIGTETGRVYASTTSFQNPDQLDGAVAQIAPSLEDIVAKHSDALVAPAQDPAARIERLKKEITGRKLPSISVRITERQIQSPAIDPAAETEMKLDLEHLGFKVIDPASSRELPDVTISGEAISEFGGRTGNLVSSRARVEIKVIQNGSGTLLLADRNTDVAVDLAETVAGKTALQNAANNLMDRIVPVLVRD